MNPTTMDWMLLIIAGAFALVLFFQRQAIERLEQQSLIQESLNGAVNRDLDALEKKTAWMVETKVQSEALPGVIDEGFMVDPKMTRRYG